MVGPCGLEPQTSTVSTYHRSQRQQLRPYRAYPLRSVIPLSQARITGRDRRYRKATATSRIPPWFASGWDVGVGVFPEGEEPLLRQADAAQEVLKARVGTQAVEPGINSKHDHAVRSVFHGFIEPAEGPVLLFQQDICSRDLIGAYIALLGQLFQVLQHPHSLRFVSRKGVDLRPPPPHERTIVEARCTLGFRDGLSIAAI